MWSNLSLCQCLLIVLFLRPLPYNSIMMSNKLLHALLALAVLLLFSCSRNQQPAPVEKLNMVALLQEIYQNENPDLNYTRNDLYLERLQAVLGKGKRDARFELGIQLMSAGKEEEAIKVLYEFATANLPNGISARNPKGIEILSWVAIAHFRLGEASNCRHNHNSSSCILPLNKEALHIDKEGSKLAQMLYAEILQHHPDHPIARWMFNLSAMTLGNYPHLVNQKWLIDFEKFADTSQRFPVFNDVAQTLGITKPGHYGGAIMEDFNNDGLLDLFDTDNPLNSDVRLFMRQSDGTLKNVTESAGLSGITGGTNAMQTDFNNDGWVDIFVTRGGWLGEGGNQPESLLRNNGDGTFTDITVAAGLLRFSPSQTAVWADFDNDGLLDLIVGYETGSLEKLDNASWKGQISQHQTKVYRNNGNETFADVTGTCGITVAEWVKGITIIDYDRDGYQDVYLSIFNGNNRLYRNTSTQGNIQFTDVSSQAKVQYPVFSFPTVSADFNNDGWPDLFVAGYHVKQEDVPKEYITDIEPLYPSYTYINQKDGTFTLDSSFALPQSIMAMSLNAADLDNDGYMDLYLGTGSGMFTSLFPNAMLKNVEGRRWANVTTTSRLGHLQKSHGIAIGDMDRDGDQDMYVELGGLYMGDYFWNALYENNLEQKLKWVNIKLEGETSNKPAIGATITIDYTEAGVAKQITRTVSSGGSYGASPMEQHIGLGNADAIKSIVISWPSGKQSVSRDVALNAYYLWKESEPMPLPRQAPAISFPSNANKHMHHHH